MLLRLPYVKRWVSSKHEKTKNTFCILSRYDRVPNTYNAKGKNYAYASQFPCNSWQQWLSRIDFVIFIAKQDIFQMYFGLNEKFKNCYEWNLFKIIWYLPTACSIDLLEIVNWFKKIKFDTIATNSMLHFFIKIQKFAWQLKEMKNLGKHLYLFKNKNWH